MNFVHEIKMTAKNILPKRVWNWGIRVFYFAEDIKRRFGRPDIYDSHTPERIGAAFTAPSDMQIEDKLFLYAFIRGIKPRRALEAGISKGGSALIISSAMEDNRIGKLVGIDPTPDVYMKSQSFFGRFEIIKEPSPQAIPRAVEILGGSLDFALIDDIHIFSQVYAELKAVLPYMAEGGYILLHDSFNYGVHAAIEAFLKETDVVHDCGLMSISPQLNNDPWTPYGGFRLLRMIPQESYVMSKIKESYQAKGLIQPNFAPDILDHDTWYCKAIKQCDRCRQTRDVRIHE
jgi:predicted O-methyltransferase YrrM